MIRRPPRSTPLYSSAASDVYKRQLHELLAAWLPRLKPGGEAWLVVQRHLGAVSYTHLRAHETKANLVCRLLLEKKKKKKKKKKSIEKIKKENKKKREKKNNI